MKHLVSSCSLSLALASLGALLGSVAIAAPAPRGPDFTGARPPGSVDPSTAASDATTPIMPSDVIAFHHNSDVVSEGALTQLVTVASWMAKHPDQRLVLEGHTDKYGRTEWNEDLATRRADSVRAQLMLRGVQSDRIVVEIFGDVASAGKPNELERAVVISTTTEPIQPLADAALEKRHALNVMWTHNGTLFTESVTRTLSSAAKANRIGTR